MLPGMDIVPQGVQRLPQANLLAFILCRLLSYCYSTAPAIFFQALLSSLGVGARGTARGPAPGQHLEGQKREERTTRDADGQRRNGGQSRESDCQSALTTRAAAR